jgi:cell division protein FtsW (lipid II flippase)
MSKLFLELANFIMLFNMAGYAFISVLHFFTKSTNVKSVICVLQICFNFFLACSAFLDMYLAKGDVIYPILFGVLAVALFMLLSATQFVYKKANRFLLNNMSMIFTVGMIVITRISTERALRQLMIFLIVLVFSMAIPYMFSKIDIWNKLTYVYAAVGLALILVVLLVGKVTNGSKITITVFKLTFQPSDAVKILFIFFLAAYLWTDIHLYKIVISAAVSAMFIITLVLSKDLGSALIFAVVYIFMVYMATGNYIYLVGGNAAIIIASIVAYNLFSHVRVRFNIWLDPWADIDNKGYQIAQSLFSINSGGLFGTGLFRGSPTVIPFCETDFVFSAVAEEMGILFGICLLIVVITSFVEMLRIASLIHNMFYRLIVYGISISLIFQTFLTVGGGTKFIPLTGVTLPLVSYGGTSLLVSSVMYFIVQAIYIKLRDESKNNLLYKFHKDLDDGKRKDKSNSKTTKNTN